MFYQNILDFCKTTYTSRYTYIYINKAYEAGLQ